jgi:hypothetical protein
MGDSNHNDDWRREATEILDVIDPKRRDLVHLIEAEEIARRGICQPDDALAYTGGRLFWLLHHLLLFPTFEWGPVLVFSEKGREPENFRWVIIHEWCHVVGNYQRAMNHRVFDFAPIAQHAIALLHIERERELQPDIRNPPWESHRRRSKHVRAVVAFGVFRLSRR